MRSREKGRWKVSYKFIRDKYTPDIYVQKIEGKWMVDVKSKYSRYHLTSFKEREALENHLVKLMDMYPVSKVIGYNYNKTEGGR